MENIQQAHIIDYMQKGSYRIIDANFNRAREALRFMEEYCRFVLNNEQLTARTKQLRHQLCACIKKLDHARLLAARDTDSDVGIGQKIQEQLSRHELEDSLAAACKRLPEALRAITEVTSPTNTSLAQKIEDLRYQAYKLEKDIFIFSSTTSKFQNVKLYVIITSAMPADVLSLTTKCAAAGADCIQIRTKELEDDQMFALTTEFVDICKQYKVLTIVNDRVDIAIAAGADGVHLGKNDLNIAQARKLQTYPLIIGRTTHTIEQLKNAIDENPTYVSLGPVFASLTKPCVEPAGLKYLEKALKLLHSTGIGHVAIGGITLENVNQVLACGAKTVAVCSAVTACAKPAEACKLLKQKLAHQGKQ